MSAAALGRETSLEELSRLAGTTPQEGTSAQNMVRAARSLGLEAQVVKTNVKGLSLEGRCAIAILDNNTHFAFVKYADDRRVTLVEELRERPMTLRDFNARWNGSAIIIGRHGDSLSSAPQDRAVWLWMCAIGAVLILVGATVPISNMIKRRTLREQGSA